MQTRAGRLHCLLCCRCRHRVPTIRCLPELRRTVDLRSHTAESLRALRPHFLREKGGQRRPQRRSFCGEQRARGCDGGGPAPADARSPGAEQRELTVLPAGAKAPGRQRGLWRNAAAAQVMPVAGVPLAGVALSLPGPAALSAQPRFCTPSCTACACPANRCVARCCPACRHPGHPHPVFHRVGALGGRARGQRRGVGVHAPTPPFHPWRRQVLGGRLLGAPWVNSCSAHQVACKCYAAHEQLGSGMVCSLLRQASLESGVCKARHLRPCGSLGSRQSF